MTTIAELAKTTGIPKADLSAKAGEMGFKGGLNGSLPKDIEEKLTAGAVKPNANGNGSSNLSLSTENKTIDLGDSDLAEKLQVAAAIGIAQAEAVLEVIEQSFDRRFEEGLEEMGERILRVYKETQEALSELKAARPTRKRQSITEKLVELQAQIAKK